MSLQSSPYIYAAELEAYFDKFSQHAQAREYWLETNGAPLQYDLPLGVSLDLVSNQDVDLSVPIDMILHLKNPPEGFMPLVNNNQIKSRLLNSLKDVSPPKSDLRSPTCFSTGQTTSRFVSDQTTSTTCGSTTRRATSETT